MAVADGPAPSTLLICFATLRQWLRGAAVSRGGLRACDLSRQGDCRPFLSVWVQLWVVSRKGWISERYQCGKADTPSAHIIETTVEYPICPLHQRLCLVRKFIPPLAQSRASRSEPTQKTRCPRRRHLGPRDGAGSLAAGISPLPRLATSMRPLPRGLPREQADVR
jgi:hypothetical protein